MLVPLTQGKYAVIDAADGPAVATRSWSAKTPKGSRTTYAQAGIDYKVVFLHRFLWAQWGNPPSLLDHEDGDGLNCRRLNIRAATRAQNAQNAPRRLDNASGYKGVSWYAADKKWVARIKAGGRHRYLGAFDDPSDAHAAYVAAARKHFGEFARAA